MEGFEDLHNESDYGVRREELAATFALLRGEVGQKILIDETEGVPTELLGQRGEETQQLN